MLIPTKQVNFTVFRYKKLWLSAFLVAAVGIAASVFAIAEGNKQIPVVAQGDIEPITVSFVSASYSGMEGSSVIVSILIASPPQQEVRLPIVITPRDGASEEDFARSPVRQKILQPGVTGYRNLGVELVVDHVVDPDESLELSFDLGDLAGIVEAGTIAVTTIEIKDVDALFTSQPAPSEEEEEILPPQDDGDSSVSDEPELVHVSFEQASYNVAEGNILLLSLTRTFPLKEELAIPFAITPQGGASEADYFVVGEHVVFEPDSLTSNALAIELVADSDPDDTQGGEFIEISIDTGGLAGVEAGDVPVTVVYIEEAGTTTGTDPPDVQPSPAAAETSPGFEEPEVALVSFSQASYTEAEGQLVSLSLTSTSPFEEGLSIPFVITPQGGASDADYFVVGEHVVFEPDSLTSNALAIELVADSDPDDAQGGEFIEISIDPGDLAGVEAGDVPFTVVYIEEAGTTTGTDPPGVQPSPAADETSPGLEEPEVVLVSFSQASYTEAEGQLVSLSLTSTSPFEEGLSIPFVITPQGGASDADYFVVGEHVVFEPDSLTSNALAIELVADSDPDDTQGGEFIEISIDTSDLAGVEAGDVPFTVVYIEEAGTTTGTDPPGVQPSPASDETSPGFEEPEVVLVSFSQASYTGAEGQFVFLSLTSTSPFEEGLSIPFVITPQGGASDADYLVHTGNNILFDPSSSISQNVFIELAVNDGVDPGESIEVRLDLSDLLGVEAGTTPVATVHIEDATLEVEEVAPSETKPSVARSHVSGHQDPVTVSFTADTYRGTEGESLTVTVTSSGPFLETTAIPFGIPVGFRDISNVETPEDRNIIFPRGSTMAVFHLQLIDGDGITTIGTSGPPLMFETLGMMLQLGDLENVEAGEITSADIEILESQVALLSFVQEEYTFSEGEVSLIPLLSTERAENGDLQVPLRFEYLGGASERDHIMRRNPNLPITPGNMLSGRFRSGPGFDALSLVSRDGIDPGESIRIHLDIDELPTLGLEPGRASSVIVHIENTDSQSGDETLILFDRSEYNVLAGENVEVTLELFDRSGAPDSVGRAFTVTMAIDTVNAERDVDYSPFSTRINVGASDTEKSFIITTLEDGPSDSTQRNELITLYFDGVFGIGLERGTDALIRLLEELREANFTAPSFPDAGSVVEVLEGASTAISVTLDADPSETVELPIIVTGKSRINGLDPADENDYTLSGTDYDAETGILTFRQGDDLTKTLTFTATADDGYDNGESVELMLGQYAYIDIDGFVQRGENSLGTVNIMDNDDPPDVFVDFSQSEYLLVEGSTSENMAEVVVRLTDSSGEPIPLRRDFTLTLTVETMNAEEDVDYRGVPDVLEFTASDVEASFVLEVLEDDVSDTSPTYESVAIQLDDPLPVIILEPSRTQGRLMRNTIAATTISLVPEVVVTVLDSSFETPTAAVRMDGATSVRRVPEGQTTALSLSIPVDPERIIAIPLLVNTHAGLDGNTVPDDNDFTLSGDYYNPEGDVLVVRPGEEGPITFGLIFESLVDGIPDRNEVVSIFIPEDQELYPVGVTPGGSPLRGGDYLIGDDDFIPVVVSFEVPPGGSYTVRENVGQEITVNLDQDPMQTLEIAIATLGSPGSDSDNSGQGVVEMGTDYTITPTIVTFESGETSTTLTFMALDDAVDDDGEAVELSFMDPLPQGVTRTGAGDTLTVNIEDDDDPDVTLSFSAAAYDVTEGGSVATIAVEADVLPERAITVAVTPTGALIDVEVDGTPLSADSILGSIAADQTTFMFELRAVDDNINDDDESVNLALGSPSSGVFIGSPDSATVNIIDDEEPSIEVFFSSPATLVVAEGNSVTVTVSLSPTPEEQIVIPITIMGRAGPDGEDPTEGSTAPGDYTLSHADYNSATGDLTFMSGETSKELTFMVNADDEDDDDEVVTLGFGSSLPDGLTVSGTGNANAVITIDDDDDPGVTLSFSAATYDVTEGGAGATIVVEADVLPERALSIAVRPSGDLSDVEMDGIPLSSNPILGSIAADQTTFMFELEAVDDTVDDGGKSVNLDLDSSTPGVSIVSPDSATVNIIDNDFPSLEVFFSAPASIVVAEGSSGVVTVTLSADPEREIVIPVTITERAGPDGDAPTDGGTAPGDYILSHADYDSMTGDLTFRAGDTSKTLTFAATTDDADDDDEVVTLGFGSSLPNGVTVSGSNDSSAVITIGDDDHPVVTLSFDPLERSVMEGRITTIDVNLSADPERDLEIPLIVEPGPQGDDGTIASALEDYNISTSVMFVSGMLQTVVNVNVLNDEVDDDGESVNVRFGDVLPPGVEVDPDMATAVVMIEDDDDPEVTLSFSATTYDATEGGAGATVIVEADVLPDRILEIIVTPSGDLSDVQRGGTPLSATPILGSIAAHQRTLMFTLDAVDDTLDDDGESVNLALSSPTSGVSIGLRSSAAVSIIDNDFPEITVSFPQSSPLNVDESDLRLVNVLLSAAPERMVAIPIIITEEAGPDGQTPTTPGDYILVHSDYDSEAGTLTFRPLETAKGLGFRAVQDTDDDDDEEVVLSFGALPTRITQASANERITLRIRDDDPAEVTVSFGLPNYEVEEGMSTAVEVTLSAAPERTLEIPLQVTPGPTGDDGTTADSSDYNVPATVTFRSDQDSVTFDIGGVNDGVDDDGESVILSFGTLPDFRVSTSTSSSDTTTIAILDTDVPALVTASFDQSGYTAGEGRTVAVTLRLSEPPDRAVTIPLTVGGEATPDLYGGIPAELSFSADQVEATFTFTAENNDEISFENQVVSLSLGAPVFPDGDVAGKDVDVDATVNIAILDDDLPGIEISFDDASPADLSEGDEVAIMATLSEIPQRAISILVSVTGQHGPDQPHGAQADTDDYTLSSSGMLEFGAEDTRAVVIFRAVDDDVDDDGEHFMLTFGNLGAPRLAGITAGPVPDVTIGITDNDVPRVTVGFDQSRFLLDEGNNAPRVTVRLDRPPERQITVEITHTPVTTGSDGGVAVFGSGSSGDYFFDSTTVTFGGAQTEVFIDDIETTDDSDDDDGENVVLGLNPSGSRVMVVPAGDPLGLDLDRTATLIIRDNDYPEVMVSFSFSSYTVDEGGSGIDVTVDLSHIPDREITVPVIVRGGLRSSLSTGFPVDLTFGASEMAQSFRVAASDDGDDEDKAPVILGLDLSGFSADDRISTGARGTTAINIVDDDVSVSFSESSYTVEEGLEGTIIVRLSEPAPRALSLYIEGYAGLSTNEISFSIGEADKSVSVMGLHDADSEDESPVTLSLVSSPSGSPGIDFGSPLSNTSASLRVTDDDIAALSFDRESYFVEEGETILLGVSLDQPLREDITLRVDRRVPGTSTVGTVIGSVTFGSGGNIQENITLMVEEDMVAEPDAIFDLVLSYNPSEGLQHGVNFAIGRIVATLTVLDNDRELTFTPSPSSVPGPRVEISVRGASGSNVRELDESAGGTVVIEEFNDPLPMPEPFGIDFASGTLFAIIPMDSSGNPIENFAPDVIDVCLPVTSDARFGVEGSLSRLRMYYLDTDMEGATWEIVEGASLAENGEHVCANVTQFSLFVLGFFELVELSFDSESYVVEEGEGIRLGVMLDRPLRVTEAVTLRVDRRVPGTSAVGTVIGSVTFVSGGVTEAAITLTVDEDPVAEPDATFDLVLSYDLSEGLQHGVNFAIGRPEATLTVLDDDRERTFTPSLSSVPGPRVEISVRGASGSNVRKLDESAGGTVVIEEFTAPLPSPEPFGIDFADGTSFAITPMDSSGNPIETFAPGVIDVCLPVTSDARFGVEGSLSRLSMYYLDIDMDGLPVEGATWEIVEGASLAENGEHVCANVTQFSLFVLGFVELVELSFDSESYVVEEGKDIRLGVMLDRPLRVPEDVTLRVDRRVPGTSAVGTVIGSVTFVSGGGTEAAITLTVEDDADTEDATFDLVLSYDPDPDPLAGLQHGVNFAAGMTKATLMVLDNDRERTFPLSVPGGSGGSSPGARVDVNVRGASGSHVRELDESAGGTVVIREFTGRLPRPEPFGIDFASGTLFDITPRDSSRMRIETFEPDVIDVCLPVTSSARFGVEGSLSRLSMYYLETDMDGSPVEGATWDMVEGARLAENGEHVCANITQFSLFVLGFVELEEDDSRRARLLPPTGGISVSSVWLFVLFSLGGLLVTSGSIWLAVSRRRVFTSR